MIDRFRRGFAPRIAGVGLILGSLGVLPGTAGSAGPSQEDLLRFAADMAEGGSWREARYRWEAALANSPDDAKVLNNLAVAREVMGDTDGAREYYGRAVRLASWNDEIQDNARRFTHFWRYNWATDDEDPIPVPIANGDRKKEKSKTSRITVRLPVPPRIEIVGDETLLVTSFRAGESTMVDTNYEMVEFLRGEFRKHTTMNILDIDPPPAIPEQTIEDLVANAEFWQHLGRNYEARLIVSGVVDYTKRDLSGYQDVDIISPDTGQKVRQNIFVEQEEFRYVADLLFMDGPTGALRFRDRLQRAVVFQGKSNDPVTAFYSLTESVVADVLAVVSTRVREDTRLIFRR